MTEITPEIAKQLSKLPNIGNYTIHSAIIDKYTEFIIHYSGGKVYLSHISEYKNISKSEYKLKEI